MRPARRLLPGAAALALLAAPAPAEAQWSPFRLHTMEEWYGDDGFVWLLHGKLKLEFMRRPIRRRPRLPGEAPLPQDPPQDDWYGGDPKDRLVVILDSPAAIAHGPGALEAFGRQIEGLVRGGASLLLACDTEAANPVLKSFGARIQGGLLQPAKGPLAFYGFPDCPILSDLSPHPATAGVGRIATNRPAVLFSETLPVLARYPAAVLPEALEAGAAPGPARGFLAAGEWGAGRVALVADHSVFINLMISEEGNGRLAENLLQWLRPRTSRKRVLYFQRSVPQPPPSGPPVMPGFLSMPEDGGDWDKINTVLGSPELGEMLEETIRKTVDEKAEALQQEIPEPLPLVLGILALAGIFWVLRAGRRPPAFPRDLLYPEGPGKETGRA